MEYINELDKMFEDKTQEIANTSSIEVLSENTRYAMKFYNLVKKCIKSCKEMNKLTYLDFVDSSIGEWLVVPDDTEEEYLGHASNVKMNKYGLTIKLYFSDKKSPKFLDDNSNYDEAVVNRILRMYGINVESSYDSYDEESIVVVKYTKTVRRVFTPDYEPRKMERDYHELNKVLKQKRSK